MVELTNAQEEILGSLRQAVWDGNFQEVQNVLDNNEHNDIQAVLSYEGVRASHKDNFLDFAIIVLNAEVKAQRKIRKNVEIIKKFGKLLIRKFVILCVVVQ